MYIYILYIYIYIYTYTYLCVYFKLKQANTFRYVPSFSKSRNDGMSSPAPH